MGRKKTLERNRHCIKSSSPFGERSPPRKRRNVYCLGHISAVLFFVPPKLTFIRKPGCRSCLSNCLISQSLSSITFGGSHGLVLKECSLISHRSITGQKHFRLFISLEHGWSWYLTVIRYIMMAVFNVWFFDNVTKSWLYLVCHSILGPILFLLLTNDHDLTNIYDDTSCTTGQPLIIRNFFREKKLPPIVMTA